MASTPCYPIHYKRAGRQGLIPRFSKLMALDRSVPLLRLTRPGTAMSIRRFGRDDYRHNVNHPQKWHERPSLTLHGRDH